MTKLTYTYTYIGLGINNFTSWDHVSHILPSRHVCSICNIFSYFITGGSSGSIIECCGCLCQYQLLFYDTDSKKPRNQLDAEGSAMGAVVCIYETSQPW